MLVSIFTITGRKHKTVRILRVIKTRPSKLLTARNRRHEQKIRQL